MNVEDQLAGALSDAAARVRMSPDPWSENRRRVRRRTGRRTALGFLAAVPLTVVGATLVTARQGGGSTVEQPGASPTSTMQSTTTPQVVLDRVAVSGLPERWSVTGAPRTESSGSGTLTRQDVVVGAHGEGGGAILRVYRGSGWDMLAATHDVRGAGTTAGGDDGRGAFGIVTWTTNGGAVFHRTGYVRLSPDVFLVLSGGWDQATVERILHTAHLVDR